MSIFKEDIQFMFLVKARWASFKGGLKAQERCFC